MLRKLCTVVFSLAFAFAIVGCEENEHKVTEKKETTHETQPTDSSPGGMVVE
ncbi:MAG: hypothetical protein IPK83_22545 [Planctomycetes bacterium]|nr:hypothetical protein [Planctomycetota bacterium]